MIVWWSKAYNLMLSLLHSSTHSLDSIVSYHREQKNHKAISGPELKPPCSTWPHLWSFFTWLLFGRRIMPQSHFPCFCILIKSSCGIYVSFSLSSWSLFAYSQGRCPANRSVHNSRSRVLPCRQGPLPRPPGRASRGCRECPDSPPLNRD